MIKDKLQNQPVKQYIMLGDFNLAPKPNDGIFNGKISKFTTHKERTLLKEILDSNGLIDFL